MADHKSCTGCIQKKKGTDEMRACWAARERKPPSLQTSFLRNERTLAWIRLGWYSSTQVPLFKSKIKQRTAKTTDKKGERVWVSRREREGGGGGRAR